MVIFHSYVKLPEGRLNGLTSASPSELPHLAKDGSQLPQFCMGGGSGTGNGGFLVI